MGRTARYGSTVWIPCSFSMVSHCSQTSTCIQFSQFWNLYFRSVSNNFKFRRINCKFIVRLLCISKPFSLQVGLLMGHYGACDILCHIRYCYRNVCLLCMCKEWIQLRFSSWQVRINFEIHISLDSFCLLSPAFHWSTNSSGSSWDHSTKGLSVNSWT